MYCEYAILKWGWKPREFANLPINEKAFVIACIRHKVDEDKKLKAELNHSTKRKR